MQINGQNYSGLEESGEKVFIPFPKPSRDMKKCKRWLVACSREFFAEKNTTRSTYICALHWPGENSFIDEECVDEKCAMIDTPICVNPSGSQTIYSKYELSAKVESMVLKNDVFTTARYHYSNTDHDYRIRLGL